MSEQHHKVDCPQEDRLVRIEEEFANHRGWRKETSAALSSIEVQLATLNERLRSKLEVFDKHVDEGVTFRKDMANTSLGIVVTLVIAIISAAIGYGMLANQVEVNTKRWENHKAE